MNSFNKTEAAVFSCRLCFLRAFPFIIEEMYKNVADKADRVMLNGPTTKKTPYKNTART